MQTENDHNRQACAAHDEWLLDLERTFLLVDKAIIAAGSCTSTDHALLWNLTLAAIAETPARTPAGMLVKARRLLREMIRDRSAHGAALARSLIADLERLAAEPGA